jgi:hypothetical protein
MSEETTAPSDDAGSDFEPITSQDALDKVIGQRIDRVKKQYADHDEYKAKAVKYDELEAANKTESQRNSERIAALEQELATERTNSLRTKVASDKGVPASALLGSTQEELEASADQLLEWRGAETPKPTKPARGLKSGATTTDPAVDDKDRAAQAVRRLFNNQ